MLLIAADPAYAEWVDKVGDGVPPFDNIISLAHLPRVHSLKEAANLLYHDRILADPVHSIRRSFLNPLNIRVGESNQLLMTRLPGTEGA